MMTPAQIATVKATAPVLAIHGEAITAHFYRRMLSGNPELKNLFNQGHQANGNQSRALAGAVYAYAEHIENPSVLAGAVQHIARRHVSLGVTPEQYPIVGGHLLASIQEVLGDAATPEIIDAWAAAYGQLADLMIGVEAGMYREAAGAEGGWAGWRDFKVQRKIAESDEITSFYLVPADGGAVPAFRAGQYVSVNVTVPALGITQPRQYSLSDAPHGRWLRISVKREVGDASCPAGLVSNLLHDGVNEGDVLPLSVPQGNFHLDDEASTPVVMISGGVGITPMIGMLNTLVWRQSPRRAVFAHACRNGRVHAMRDRLNRIVEECPQVSRAVFYETVEAQDQPGRDHDHVGRIDLAAHRDALVVPDADYYICGPVPFMQEQRDALLALGVPAARVHWEVFGTGTLPQ